MLEAGGDGGDVGLVAAARTLPLVLFLLIGGAVADRLPRHRVMFAANALNCLSQAAFAVLVLSGEAELWQMMLFTALGGTGQAFFSPAAEGMLLKSVEGEQASRAFAVFRMAMRGAAVGGAALGGAMVATIGPGWVLAADAAAFAVAGSMRAFLDVGHIPQRVRGGGMLADLREGWREFAGRPWLWGIVVQFSIANAVVGAADAVYGPLVARDHLGGTGPWGLALGFFGGHRRGRPADDPPRCCTAARCLNLVAASRLDRYAPGARYWTCPALRRASMVSSMVRSTVVSNELSEPPPLIATATAAMETLSGASHRL
ncbi:MFS transporter [Streptomyces chartreusis]|uniref:MFS transporter n=1 Tax=Streptomyces chartreusis TaxID=1969 RepID=UPI00368551A3